MKRLILTIAVLFAAVTAFAQEYSTAWPYLYNEFTPGEVLTLKGSKLEYPMNIHILHGRLHFIDNGLIKEAATQDIVLARIGEDEFLSVDQDVMKIMKRTDDGMVVAHLVGDFEKLNEAGGAYGSSTTSSATRKLTSVDVQGKVNQNHMELREGRHDGELVDLKTTYYIVIPGMNKIPATKKGVEEAIGPERKADFKNWLKSHKVKWNKPESVAEVISFIAQ